MGVHRAEGAEGEVCREQGRRTRRWPHPTLNTPCPSNQPRYSKCPPALSLLKLWGFASLTRGWLAVKQPAPPDPHVTVAKYHRPIGLLRAQLQKVLEAPHLEWDSWGLLPLLASRGPPAPSDLCFPHHTCSMGTPLTPRTRGGPHRDRLARCRHCPGRRSQREEHLSTGAATGPRTGDRRPRLPWGRAGLRSVPGTKMTG